MQSNDCWTTEQTDAWKKGTWTRQTVKALEVVADEHIDTCDECNERLKIDPTTLPDDEAYYCTIGESLSEEFMQALTEFSWQPNWETL